MIKRPYLNIPLRGLKELTILELAILTQLQYMKKEFDVLYPSNSFISKKLHISSRTIQRVFKTLSQLDYIIIEIKNKYKRTIILTDKTKQLYKVEWTEEEKKLHTNEINKALDAFYKSYE